MHLKLEHIKMHFLRNTIAYIIVWDRGCLNNFCDSKNMYFLFLLLYYSISLLKVVVIVWGFCNSSTFSYLFCLLNIT